MLQKHLDLALENLDIVNEENAALEQSLADAITRLNKGRKMGLYQDLGGQPGQGGGRGRQ